MYYQDDAGMWDWFVSGEFVFDRILGVRRAEHLLVHCPNGSPPNPVDVRNTFGLPAIIGVDVVDVLPRMIMTLDFLVVLPSGSFFDVRADSPASPPKKLCVELIEFDLTAGDILRLTRLRDGYEELEIDDLLIARLRSESAHLESLRSSFPELETEFMKVEALASWRVRHSMERPQDT